MLKQPNKPENPLSFRDKIRLDRYAIKGNRNNIQPGDWVVTLTVEHPKFPVKEIGIVQAVNGTMVDIELISGGSFGEVFTQYIGKTDKLLEFSWEQICHRIALGLASVELPGNKGPVYSMFYKQLLEGKIVPAGRINTGAGTKEYKESIGATAEELTLFNCYVVPHAQDSRWGMIESLGIQVEIHSRGGGVGQDWSSGRPRTSPVIGVRGRSSGSVSWGGGKSYYTGLIEQGGSRRGATMGMIRDWHPDLVEFVTCKLSIRPRKLPDGTTGAPIDYIRNKWQGKFPGSTIYAHGVENANLSVLISDAFMEAVKNDGDWALEFPDTTHPDYNAKWVTEFQADLPMWKAAGLPTVVYHTYKARELRDLMLECMWMSAEPGWVFIDRYRAFANSNYYPRGLTIATNPCGEQGLPAWGVCNLSAINLAKFVLPDGSDVDWEALGETVETGVRFLDNVIDHTPYHFQENREQQEGERRIGLGIMGYAEMLIKLGLRYGSPEALEFTDKLGKFMAIHGYAASIELAKEKGAFKWFEADGFLASEHMKQNILPVAPYLEAGIREYGIRNVTIFTIAPTGSTGTMTGTSTGCEPYFAFTYWRNSRLGMAEIVEDCAADWLKANGYEVTTENLQHLPAAYVSAMELTPEEHILAQAAWQKWVCSSISKTCNAPNEHTVEDIANIIDLAYDTGLKGFTYYRDGSRDEQVLATSSAGLFGGTEERPELARLAQLDTASLKGLISVAEGYGLFPNEAEAEEGQHRQPTTEELTIMLSGCIGGKCSNE
jgi:ribonucleoside-diphosphate reductase alpha chain